MTVKRAIAASATTLQQCGLPGSSAQPGGIAAAHGTGGGGGGGLGKRSSPCWPAWRGGGIAAGRTPGRQCPGDTQCHEAAPTGRHCSSVHLLGGALPSLQPGSSLLLAVVYGLPAMAPSQSLIPAYPPLTSFQDSAADARDFRVVLCAVQRRANAGGTRGSDTSGERGVKN